MFKRNMDVNLSYEQDMLLREVEILDTFGKIVKMRDVRQISNSDKRLYKEVYDGCQVHLTNYGMFCLYSFKSK